MYESTLLQEINLKTLSTLPQIYDNSLTEYEMMCRLAEKVNEIILSLNGVDEEIKAQVIEYCKTENLTNIVAEYLNQYRINVKYPPMGITSAVGNGVVDDTESIKQCINYAIKNNLAVVFPKGNYKITETIELLHNGSIVLKSETGAKIINENILFNGIKPLDLSIINLEITGPLITDFPTGLLLRGVTIPEYVVNTNYSFIENCIFNTLSVNADYCCIFNSNINTLNINGNNNTVRGTLENINLTGDYNDITSIYESVILIDNGVFNSVSTQNLKDIHFKNIHVKSENINVNECLEIDNEKNVLINGNSITSDVQLHTENNNNFIAVTRETRSINSNRSDEYISTSKTVNAETITENAESKNITVENLNVTAENIKVNKDIEVFSPMFKTLKAKDKDGNIINFLVGNENTHKVSGFEGNTHTNTHFRYYVDCVNGNDENDGKTQAKAFKTLQKVFELINKGQSEIRAYIVSSGIYTVDVGNVFNGVAIHLTGKVDGVTVRFISDSDRIAFYNSHVNYQNIKVECTYSDIDVITDTTPMGIYYENTAVYFNLVNHAQTGNITFYGCYIYLEDLTAYTIECLATNGFIHELIIKADKLGLKAIQVKHGSIINFFGALKANNLDLDDTDNASCFIYVNGGILLCRSACPSNFNNSIGKYHWGVYAVNSIILMNMSRLKTYSDYSTNGIFVSGVQFLDISDYKYNSFNDLSNLRISTLDTDD